jgi:hypothetical protein
MTMKPIRCLFQPPTQQTCQSPKRDPSVTAIGRRRNLVSNCICDCRHHIHHLAASHSQVAFAVEFARQTRSAPRFDLLSFCSSQCCRACPERFRRTPPTLKTGFRPCHSGAWEARLYLFANVANGEGVPVKRVAAADLHGTIAYMQRWHAELDVLRAELVALIQMLAGSPLN